MRFNFERNYLISYCYWRGTTIGYGDCVVHIIQSHFVMDTEDMAAIKEKICGLDGNNFEKVVILNLIKLN